METVIKHALEIRFTSLVDGPVASFSEKDGMAVRESPTKGANLYATSLPEEVSRSVDALTSLAGLGE